MKIKALIEKRNGILSEMDALMKNAETETRALTNEELSQLEALKAEVIQLGDTIKALQEAAKLSDEAGKAEKNEGNADTDKNNSAAEERAFAGYIRGIVEERADVNLTASDNGAVIPSSIANKIITKVADMCPIYQLATKYNVGGTLTIPYYDETSAKITMAYATEFSSLESSAGKFLSIELKGYLAGALSKISKSLINNSQFDIVNYVVNAMAQSISQWIEGECLNGTSGKIDGLSGIKQIVTAAASTAVTADELIDLQESIPDVYQGNAVWLMSKKTRAAIRKLKDSNGDYLLNKDANTKWGYTLFGKEIYTSENISGMEAGKPAIFYGDFSGLAVKVSEDMSIEVLREKYSEQHAIGILAWLEIDAKVENAQKISKLVMKAGS